MKVAALFSGGKDSNFALFEASKKHEISCLVTMVSENLESYMFQTPGNDFVDFQAECLGIDLIKVKTLGEKEKELVDLKKALVLAKKKYGIEGVVTGAIKSAYQSSRIQKICYELDLWCFNPLWQIDEHKFLEEIVSCGFEVMIIGVFAYPLSKKYVGKIIDKKLIKEFFEMEKKYSISPAFEGGEAESFVLDSPLFKKKIEIVDFEFLEEGENCVTMIIKKVEMVDK